MSGWKKAGGLLGLFVLLLLGVPLGWSQDQPKVAVLPFIIHGQQDTARLQKNLGDVFNRLLTSEGVRVVEPAGGVAVQTEDQARSAASRLGAGFVLFGSFNQVGSSISLDAKLVDLSGRRATASLFAEERG